MKSDTHSNVDRLLHLCAPITAGSHGLGSQAQMQGVKEAEAMKTQLSP